MEENAAVIPKGEWVVKDGFARPIDGSDGCIPVLDGFLIEKKETDDEPEPVCAGVLVDATGDLLELYEKINPAALAYIAGQNNKINAIRELIHSCIEGYISGKGWSLETHNIDFNINTGMVSVTPK